MPEQFVASVQYNDFEGTSAADNSDQSDILNFLRARDLINENDRLVGIEISFWEHTSGHEVRVFLSALIVDASNMDDAFALIKSTRGPVPVKKLHFTVNLQQLCDLFKRFSVKLSYKGILGGREITITEERHAEL